MKTAIIRVKLESFDEAVLAYEQYSSLNPSYISYCTKTKILSVEYIPTDGDDIDESMYLLPTDRALVDKLEIIQRMIPEQDFISSLNHLIDTQRSKGEYPLYFLSPADGVITKHFDPKDTHVFGIPLYTDEGIHTANVVLITGKSQIAGLMCAEKLYVISCVKTEQQ